MLFLFVSLSAQSQKYLFTTTNFSINEYSRPEKKGEMKLVWIWDYYSSSTLLIGQPEEGRNWVFTVTDLEKDENGIYYMYGEISVYFEGYYEIILDRQNKSVTLNSIYPESGTTMKLYNK